LRRREKKVGPVPRGRDPRSWRLSGPVKDVDTARAILLSRFRGVIFGCRWRSRC